MSKKQWYETLFENYAQKYDNEVFTQGTIGECDFIEQELNQDSALKILDSVAYCHWFCRVYYTDCFFLS